MRNSIFLDFAVKGQFHGIFGPREQNPIFRSWQFQILSSQAEKSKRKENNYVLIWRRQILNNRLVLLLFYLVNGAITNPPHPDPATAIPIAKPNYYYNNDDDNNDDNNNNDKNFFLSK